MLLLKEAHKLIDMDELMSAMLFFDADNTVQCLSIYNTIFVKTNKFEVFIYFEMISHTLMKSTFIASYTATHLDK